jgi:hypothetical protein
MWRYPALLCLICALSCGSWAQMQPAAQPSQAQSSSTLKLADGTPIKLRIGQIVSAADARPVKLFDWKLWKTFASGIPL